MKSPRFFKQASGKKRGYFKNLVEDVKLLGAILKNDVFKIRCWIVLHVLHDGAIMEKKTKMEFLSVFKLT